MILDENNLRKLPMQERMSECEKIIRFDKNQSKRWDAVWLVGEIARQTNDVTLFNKIADLLAWTLDNDDDGVVKHEVCYQIATCNMRHKIKHLVKTSLSNPSSLARHEALECLAFMQATDVIDDISPALDDPVPYVRDTAEFAIKRLSRMKENGEKFQTPKIL